MNSVSVVIGSLGFCCPVERQLQLLSKVKAKGGKLKPSLYNRYSMPLVKSQRLPGFTQYEPLIALEIIQPFFDRLTDTTQIHRVFRAPLALFVKLYEPSEPAVSCD